MGLMKNLAVFAPLLAALSAASPTPASAARQATPSYVPHTLNTTQEFYIHLKSTSGQTKYDGYTLEAYHTGAGLADPVFVPITETYLGTPAYLNGTKLQFDVNTFPFGAYGFPGDANSARWEPVYIEAGYGSGTWAVDGEGHLVVDNEESDGWIVCEWYHGVNFPQLFQGIKGFDYEPLNIPSSCSRAVLELTYF